ncbi:hypothetical protein H5P28_16500 [Ruficoccus amylovorans]|uniref:Uncharacterized protein n=1 Tax=Ruficoccus amylovorans TaxID=1804625 RepID=A0A842HJX7_9BACT|nr:hypothetical protein [Ruficoccus amylovorans]MBC2595866.1 hypothetical protein [Ruficoccus amylovorans]
MELNNANANDAAKRTQPWLTATLAIIVIVAAFLLPFIASWMDMPTQIVSDEEPFSMFWGVDRLRRRKDRHAGSGVRSGTGVLEHRPHGRRLRLRREGRIDEDRLF